MAENIQIKISNIEQSDRNANDGICKFLSSKWVIIPGAQKKIDNKPSHWKVEVEIAKDLANVRIGRIVRTIKELSEEEKIDKRVQELLSPLLKSIDSDPQSLEVLREAQTFSDYNDDKIGIFAADGSNALLNESLIHEASWWTPDKIYSYSDLADNQLSLNCDLAKRLLEAQVSVWQKRDELFDEVVAIWKKERQRLSENREVRGRSYSDWLGRFIPKPEKLWTKIPLFISHKKGHLFSDDQGETFSWTKEGVAAYKEALKHFVSETIKNIVTEADEFISLQVNRLEKEDWILGTHTVYSYWTAYHDGHGSHSENDVASSGSTEHQKRGLLRVSVVGKEVGLENNTANFIPLTKREYGEIIRFINTNILNEMELRLNWLLAKEKSKRESYKEQLQLDFLGDQPKEIRFQEILKRLQEGWEVRIRDKEIGEVKNIEAALVPHNKRQDLAIIYSPKPERYRYRVNGSYGRSSTLTATRLIAKKFFLYISWKEYQKLPDVKEMKELVAEAKSLAKDIWKNKNSYKGENVIFYNEIIRERMYVSVLSFGAQHSLDCIRGYVIQMRSLLVELQESQKPEKFQNNCEEPKKSHHSSCCVVPQSSPSKDFMDDSGGFNTPFASALAGLKR